MSWWLAVPLAVLIVLGGGVILIALCAGLFWFLDRIADRMSERTKTAISAIFSAAFLLALLAAATYFVAERLAV